METKLFTNHISISSSEERVKDLLANLENIVKWDREIVDISSLDDHEFMVLRQEGAFNQQEIIKVDIKDNEITYLSSTGKIEYRIAWLIESEDSGLIKLSQSLYIKGANFIPLAKLIKAITQQAFLENLQVLKELCELEVQQ